MVTDSLNELIHPSVDSQIMGNQSSALVTVSNYVMSRKLWPFHLNTSHLTMQLDPS